jgi:hypothetical protein
MAYGASEGHSCRRNITIICTIYCEFFPVNTCDVYFMSPLYSNEVSFIVWNEI